MLVSLLLIGCTGNVADLTNKMMAATKPLAPPQGSYADVAWLEGNRVAFLYAAHLAEHMRLWDYEVVIQDLETQERRILQVPHPPECDPAHQALLKRLPNGKLGFIYGCHVYHNGVTGEIDSLYMWDNETNTFQVLKIFPENWAATAYSFAPGMSQWIQERARGTELGDLYRITRDGKVERLLENFARAETPVVSPDGRQIAFLGTENFAGKKPTELSSPSDIRDLLFSPYDLYVAEANGENARKMLSGIRFGGVMNLDSKQLLRVWPDNMPFDWSPDGRQLIAIAKGNEGSEEQPMLLNAPSQFLDWLQ